MNWRALYNRRKRYASKHVRGFKKAFREQIQPLIEYIRESHDPESILESLPVLIISDPIEKAYINLYKDIVNREAKHLKTRINKDITLETSADIWQLIGEQYAITYCSKRVNTIVKTTGKIAERMINKQISQGLAEGLPAVEVARNIQRAVPKFLKTNSFRAIRIARTETLTATSYASYETAQQTGLKYNKVWMVAPGGVSKVERHTGYDGLDGQVRAMDDDFDVGGEAMAYPGDPRGSAGNVVNCKCDYYFEPIEEAV